MKRHIPLLLIVIIGALLRFWHLTTIPPSLSHDEVAIAYNAYSVFKTGKDEYGKPYPILFRSFDDYKLPGMVYSTIPFVALFGRTELAARLPSALYGTLALIVMYFLVLELTGSTLCSLLSALLLAIQPWHINFSRQLFESNGAVFWFMVGTYFLLRSRKNYRDILWAGIGYVIALYFYYSVRLVIPFVGILYIAMYWKTVMKQWKTTLLAASVCTFIFLPLGKEMFSPGGLERISMVSVANDPNYANRRDDYIQQMGANPSLGQKILYNRRVALALTVIENYWKNISPHNLFVAGTGTFGALYRFEILLIPIGLLTLFSSSQFSTLVILTWLFTAFLPGALSVNQPNTLRTLIAAPVFAILSGFGLTYVVTTLKSHKKKWALPVSLAIFVLAFVVSFPKFYYAYFVDNPTHNALAFGDGYKQMIQYVKAHENEYDTVVISGYYWRPYIFMLYWGGIDPVAYQSGGTREKFDKYIFTAAPWDNNGIKLMDKSFKFSTLSSGKTLYILSNPEYKEHSAYLQQISAINGRHGKNVFVVAIIK